MSEEEMEESTTNELKKYLRKCQTRVSFANIALRRSDGDKKKKLEQRLELNKAHLETVQEKIHQREGNGARGYRMSEEDMRKITTNELKEYLRKCQQRVWRAEQCFQKAIGEQKKKLEQTLELNKVLLETLQEKIRQREGNGARGYRMSEEDMKKSTTTELKKYLHKCQNHVSDTNYKMRKSAGEKKKETRAETRIKQSPPGDGAGKDPPERRDSWV